MCTLTAIVTCHECDRTHTRNASSSIEIHDGEYYRLLSINYRERERDIKRDDSCGANIVARGYHRELFAPSARKNEMFEKLERCSKLIKFLVRAALLLLLLHRIRRYPAMRRTTISNVIRFCLITDYWGLRIIRGDIKFSRFEWSARRYTEIICRFNLLHLIAYRWDIVRWSIYVLSAVTIPSAQFLHSESSLHRSISDQSIVNASRRSAWNSQARLDVMCHGTHLFLESPSCRLNFCDNARYMRTDIHAKGNRDKFTGARRAAKWPQSCIINFRAGVLR